ncbi:hypothetical protein [Hungatella effluvii]|uniref:hypothetical protein n=1 Tax=Hungatella effluvii TaxID=1096246 RepID=UPI0022DF9491|nr:hypothetical protein [Hungatella effluvii]
MGHKKVVESKMKALYGHLNSFDPFKKNERYVPEDKATLQYARISISADGKWVGVSLYPRHLSVEEILKDHIVQSVCRDYVWAQELEIRLECFEHISGETKRGLVDSEFSLFYLGALDLQTKVTKRFRINDEEIRVLDDYAF